MPVTDSPPWDVDRPLYKPPSANPRFSPISKSHMTPPQTFHLYRHRDGNTTVIVYANERNTLHRWTDTGEALMLPTAKFLEDFTQIGK